MTLNAVLTRLILSLVLLVFAALVEEIVQGVELSDIEGVRIVYPEFGDFANKIKREVQVDVR